MCIFVQSVELSPVQTDATVLANNSQHCWMLHVASVCTPCCMLLDVVAQSFKPVKLFSQQLSTFLLFCDRRKVAQQCWMHLQSSSNIVGATHAYYAWFTKIYGLYPSHDALQVPALLGVVASVCTPLPAHTQQLPTLLTQQCRELLCPFARSLTFLVGDPWKSIVVLEKSLKHHYNFFYEPFFFVFPSQSHMCFCSKGLPTNSVETDHGQSFEG